MASQCRLNELPPELLVKVAGYLSPAELFRLRLTSTAMKDFVDKHDEKLMVPVIEYHPLRMFSDMDKLIKTPEHAFGEALQTFHHHYGARSGAHCYALAQELAHYWGTHRTPLIGFTYQGVPTQMHLCEVLTGFIFKMWSRTNNRGLSLENVKRHKKSWTKRQAVFDLIATTTGDAAFSDVPQIVSEIFYDCPEAFTFPRREVLSGCTDGNTSQRFRITKLELSHLSIRVNDETLFDESPFSIWLKDERLLDATTALRWRGIRYSNYCMLAAIMEDAYIF